jgi:ketosteroid isomerase-like protein
MEDTMKWRAAKAARRLGLTALLALVFALRGVAQTATDTEKELIAIEDEWRTARMKGDVAFLERLYGKDLRITGTDGSVIDRTTDIAGFASGAIKPESIERSDMRISVYGDAAIVIGRDDLKGRYNGVVGGGAVRFTHVYVRREARWQLVASHGTWIQKK